ncbi:MAG: hypothetical protein KA184_16360 [Candidatus Hydrogenedentes bacterium]|nr:hypothetical protein [Candidatus Hydrogenedentota bacterium]
MKRVFVVAGILSAIVLTGAAAAQDNAVVQKALALGLAEELGLDAGETVAFYSAFNAYAAQAATLEAGRAQAAGLDALVAIDKQLLDLRVKAAEEMSTGLAADQKVKVYSFLAQAPELARAAVSGAPCAAAAPPTCPSAAAASAEQPAAAASPEDQVKATVAAMKKALEGLDLDALMETFSEDFHHPEVGGKEEAKYMLQMGIDMGYADDGEVYTDDMEIEVDGNEATVYPVELSSPAGSVSVELVLAQEGGKWLITTVNPDGL